MRISRSVQVLAAACCAATSAYASHTMEEMSLGLYYPISNDKHTIPNWRVSGAGHDPQILSDRIILTPPYPGNKRGALWSVFALDKNEFVVDVEFRASGQERGNGNLQIWLTKESQPVGQTNSIYTVGQFDGLVLSIDQYGGSGGKVRAFLNDGTVSFKDHHSVDSLAFGQCDYSYRNKGALSHLKMTQTGEIFAVEVDGRQCFQTNKVTMPMGYYFGISAASAENPDSFELWKFIVSPHEVESRQNQPPKEQQAQQPIQQQPIQQQPPPPPQQQQQQQPAGGASVSQPTWDQVNDVNNRVYSVEKKVDNIYRLLQEMQGKQDQKFAEVVAMGSNGPIHEHVRAVETVVGRIQSIVTAIQKDIEGKDYKEHLANLHDALRDTQSGLRDSLTHVVTSSAPKMWTFVFLVVIFQVVMFGGYLVYKRRREIAPKKYL
ncbi:putative lectin family integral membrane protein [Phyllosticta citrichinensis]|uniref:Lectin family integral membrane protein n=1 Tax=Phyllosticta citrichinensis TaxID=1130410 RepID=A0ABR1XHA0_9PEZI